MIKVEVNRNRWLRGTGGPSSRLLASGSARAKAGTMCCLGFCARTFGFSELNILQVASPAKVLGSSNLTGTWPPGFVEYNPDVEGYMNTRVVHEMMRFNDSRDIDDQWRERHLIQLAAQLDVELVFVDGEPLPETPE